MLDGYKSYLVGILAIFVVGLNATGVLTDEVTNRIIDLLGGLGILAIRRAISTTKTTT